jgi:CRP-like cAMP-binding protein
MSSIEDDISFLESVPLFRLVGRSPLRVIAMGAETQIVHESQVLFDDPDVVDAGYVVKHGRFGLRGARETDPAFIAGSGALLGELVLISETVRPSPVTALELSTVIRIPRLLFIKMLDGYPDAALRLRDHMATRAERTISEMTRLRTVLNPAAAKS